MATVTIEIADSLLQLAQDTAEILERPLEDIVAGALARGLPDVQDAPPAARAELLRMTWLDDEQLWQIAESEMPVAEQRELQALADAQEARPLSSQEMKRLRQLREIYGLATLRKARAYALLSVRGGKPLLSSSPISK